MRSYSVPYSDLLAPIHSFLKCETPDEWIAAATKNLDIVLIDHLICELKAAQARCSYSQICR